MTKKLSQLEQDILEGLREVLAGEAQPPLSARERTEKRRGRPPLPTVKVSVKIRLDADLLGVLRASGAGWQTRINETLRREFMAPRPTASQISIFAAVSLEPTEPDLLVKVLGASLMKPYREFKQPQGAYIA